MPLYGIFAIAVLMIVHECGHYFAARAFGMRVERFSIGFGPSLVRHRSKASDTVFQLAAVPFGAYVQIAGMNPFEEADPTDKGSYANASLVGRIVAILAGSLANYFFASVVFFASMMIGGKAVETTELRILPGGAADKAALVDGDRLVAIDGRKIGSWTELRTTVRENPGKRLEVTVLRGGVEKKLFTTPERGKDGAGAIGVSPMPAPMPVGEALRESIAEPAMIVALTVKSLYRVVTGQEKGQLSGPLGMMRETEKAAGYGLASYLAIIGFLSTSVGFFNLLPVPALDGGRLLFLAYEGITRRRPNQKREAQMHTLGFVVLITTILLVTIREFRSGKSPSEEAAEREKAEAEAAKASPGAKAPAR